MVTKNFNEKNEMNKKRTFTRLDSKEMELVCGGGHWFKKLCFDVIMWFYENC
jgi:hypothetical protein